MKSRRLTETDLANMAFRPKEAKSRRLFSLERPKRIDGSYEPFRQHNGDALNGQFALLDEVRPATSLAMLENVVSRACKGNSDLLAMNVPVARATHDHSVINEVIARRENVSRLTLPFGHAYDFGMTMLIGYGDGRIAAVFPDLRRKEPLTAVGQRFVLSAMHQRWRENYPDFAEIDLEIWRYADNELRTVRTISCADQDLISYDAIVADVRETYDLWHEVILTAAANRRTGTIMDPGPLFGRRSGA